ncbi:hypothetical protein KBY66_03960 [Synechococcus sp. Tobar12-5m-g]|uniref:hypothetical protein n=1 Tax=Synechococcus sp. Tobar12-5m-g TaxID=2823742 RepID=UPI0020CF33D4|nr:hypothetical protein [Synechococcus sp. Tobar12-5m-g]MCP9771782.1 hypothetical protein [Synechococcus sp. Tobar12-5m-g]
MAADQHLFETPPILADCRLEALIKTDFLAQNLNLLLGIGAQSRDALQAPVDELAARQHALSQGGSRRHDRCSHPSGADQEKTTDGARGLGKE